MRFRKEAAKHNDKLGRREGAAELLGISVSSLADYELGNTKVIPVDKVVLMADIYNAPELMAWYCSSECLIGKSLEMPSPEIASVERTTMKPVSYTHLDVYKRQGQNRPSDLLPVRVRKVHCPGCSDYE